jgi:hypothetical protein
MQRLRTMSPRRNTLRALSAVLGFTRQPHNPSPESKSDYRQQELTADRIGGWYLFLPEPKIKDCGHHPRGSVRCARGLVRRANRRRQTPFPVAASSLSRRLVVASGSKSGTAGTDAVTTAAFDRSAFCLESGQVRRGYTRDIGFGLSSGEATIAYLNVSLPRVDPAAT